MDYMDKDVLKWLGIHFRGVDVSLTLNTIAKGWFFWNEKKGVHERIGLKDLEEMFGSDDARILLASLTKVENTYGNIFDETLY